MNNSVLKKNIAIIGLTFVVIMFIIKAIAFKYSGSVSVLASLIDSGADFFTTIITAIAVFTSSKPADKNHRFGHGKAESVGALLQSIFIFISAGFLIWRAIANLIHGHPIHVDMITFSIMVASLLLTVILVIAQRSVIRKTKSVAIKADNVNYTGDILTTSGVILSLAITKYLGIHNMDAIFGILIAFFLCYNAKKLLKESIDVLMDKEINKTMKNKVKKEIRNHPGVLGYHNFRSRFCGQTYFIEVHIELNEDLRLKEAHEISHLLKEKIKSLHDNMDVTIHQDIHWK